MFSCCMKKEQPTKRPPPSPVQAVQNASNGAASNSKSPSPAPDKACSEPDITPVKAPEAAAPAPAPVASLDQVQVTVPSDLRSHIWQIEQALSPSSSQPPLSNAELLDQVRELQVVLVKQASVDPNMAADLASLVSRLEAVANKFENISASGAGFGGQAAEPESLVPYVVAYDEFMAASLAEFLKASSSIGGDVAIIGQNVRDLVAAQRAFLVKASKCKQPSQDELMNMLKPMATQISQIQELKERSRGSEFFNHLSTLSEAVPAFGWVAITPTPMPYAKEMADAGQFFANRVLKDWKEKDTTHADWVKSWNRTMNELQAYIKQHHTTGVAWNTKGVDASSLTTKAAAPPPPPPSAGGPPPPPPPGPPPPPAADDGGDESDANTAALFADINRGTDVTKGLRRVTDDMKTHKNPTLRLQTPQPYKASPPTAPKPFKPFATKVQQPSPTAKPPVFELDGKKWLVEYQNNNNNIVIDKTNIKQTVYIYKCTNTTVQIKGKINSVVLDSCKKSGVVFEDVISSIEFVNCQSVQGQVTGKLPTITIDKTDGCQMYLSEEAKNVDIITAKSSEMNILIPDSTGEYKEYAVVEQFRTTFNGNSLVTVPSDIAV